MINTVVFCRPATTNCSNCRASGAPPPVQSSRFPQDSACRFSTAMSAGCYYGCTVLQTGPVRRQWQITCGRSRRHQRRSAGWRNTPRRSWTLVRPFAPPAIPIASTARCHQSVSPGPLDWWRRSRRAGPESRGPVKRRCWLWQLTTTGSYSKSARRRESGAGCGVFRSCRIPMP